MHILSALLVCCALAVGEQPPIFDVHLHADSPDHWPQGRIKACPGDRAKTWPAIDPRAAHVTPDDLEDCPNPVYSLESAQAVVAETRRLMEKYNISGSVSGPEALVTRWKQELGSRMTPAIYVGKSGDPPVKRVRELIESRQVRVLGEVAIQYEGMAPNDPAFEPYWSLAEELDVPVGIHIGPGPAGGPQPKIACPVLGVWGDGDPFLIEENVTKSPERVSGPWTYERIAGAGHWLMLDKPAEVNRLLVDFLHP